MFICAILNKSINFGGNMRILIVDDEADIRRILRILLEKAKYEVIEALSHLYLISQQSQQISKYPLYFHSVTL